MVKASRVLLIAIALAALLAACNGSGLDDEA